jgi:hypothetical protein
MPRQIATLSPSMPSSGEIRGCSADGAREVETGTTANSSCPTPTTISSTDRTIAGRLFPSSRFRAAPGEHARMRDADGLLVR